MTPAVDGTMGTPSPATSPIATIVHVITCLELGGAQQNTLDTCARLDRTKFRVALLSGEGGVLDSTAARLANLDFRLVRDLVREVSPIADRRAFLRLRDHLREIAASHDLPLIVHTHSSKAGILGRLAARAVRAAGIVHTIHGFGHPAFGNALLRRAAIAAERHLAPRTDRFIAVSRANVDEGRALGLFARTPVELVRSGFDLDAFALTGVSRAEARQRLGLPREGKIVGSVACLKPQKAPLDLAAVAATVLAARDDTLFVLAGDGELRAPLEARLAALGIAGRFRLLGWRDDVPLLLRALDVFVLTSRWEGLPRAVVQAMASGVPVVASAVDGVRDVVEHGVSGLSFAPGDVAAAAGYVTSLLADDDLAARLVAAAARSVPEFDVNAMVAAQERIYLELLAAPPRAT
jgi:glycosyltransferase involved in cell wall biosynthesis